MKTSFSSTISVQTSLRTAMAKAQNELMKANEEVTTGVHADMGVSLGSQTARNLDLTRDVMRIESQLTTNSVAVTRLDSSEAALNNMSTSVDKVRGALASLTSSASTLDDARRTLTSALDSFTDAANSSVAGEYLFAGTNTDVKPLTSFTEAGSPFKAAYDAELNQFLSANGIPSKSAMTAAQVDSFLTDLEAKFNGTTTLTDPPHAGQAGQDFWTTFVSNANDTNMTTRISANEVVDTSTNANGSGFRNFVFAAVVSNEFLTTDVPEVSRQAAVKVASGAIGRAETGITTARSNLGISSERVKNANESLESQKKIFELHLNDLQGVDAYEASTRVTSLKALLEASYTLTSRIQQLSLVNFL
ncbi:flagellar hook-associated family protein [Rhizobium sp. FKY42]|uniref:flagellar hook-associated family protein n=1 Tax=Rhizobium sp. FKY42 TaxID=2562310 RepID=UPI0010C0C007|nr:flagellar hook-associated family protein [Rhizobium sp. FKY42]